MHRRTKPVAALAALAALTLSACGSGTDSAAAPASGNPSYATSAEVRAQSMAFYRLADGKIVEERAQLDMLSLLQQMGAVPGA
jgi:predicted outer membrane protein